MFDTLAEAGGRVKHIPFCVDFGPSPFSECSAKHHVRRWLVPNLIHYVPVTCHTTGSGPRIVLGHGVHPDIKKFHKSYGTPSKDLCYACAHNKEACAVCFKLDGPGFGLRCCTRCKHVSYCPTEVGLVLKDHTEGSSLHVMKIIQNLTTSSFLSMQLQICLVIACNLLCQPRIDEPFMAHIDVGIEPTDILEFFKIYFNREPAGEVKGMVQINAFTAMDDEVMIGEGEMTMWCRAWETTDAAGFTADPVGLIMVSKASMLTVIYPLVIHIPILDLVHQNPKLQYKSVITGQVTLVPLNIDTCMLRAWLLQKKITRERTYKLVDNEPDLTVFPQRILDRCLPVIV
ncbi:hypothetical protein B0H10DRAFT_1937800 [Mycena sp. CBHHK59/15]|nr:hypothetical protein B0H10DRAFT_1937800 [Mycena sp. CBHHK59/15]